MCSRFKHLVHSKNKRFGCFIALAVIVLPDWLNYNKAGRIRKNSRSRLNSRFND